MLCFFDGKNWRSMVSRQFWITFLFAITSRIFHEAAKQSRKERTRFSSTCSNLLYSKHAECWICWSTLASLLLLYDQQQQQSKCRESGCFFFCVWDPLGQPVESFQLFFDHLIKFSQKKQNSKKFATLAYQSSLHIQTLVVSIASTSRTIWFKKFKKTGTLLRLRMF